MAFAHAKLPEKGRFSVHLFVLADIGNNGPKSENAAVLTLYLEIYTINLVQFFLGTPENVPHKAFFLFYYLNSRFFYRLSVAFAHGKLPEKGRFSVHLNVLAEMLFVKIFWGNFEDRFFF